MIRSLPRPPTRNDSWKTVGSITRPRPSLGGKIKPSSKRTNPKENPANGPAAASFSRSSRLRTILTILVIAPKDPIYNKLNNARFIMKSERTELDKPIRNKK